MDILVYIIVACMASGFILGFVRRLLQGHHARRLDAERQAYEDRRRADGVERANAAVAQLADRFFPFARGALEGRTGGEAPRERLRTILARTPGLVLGTASIGFPAMLPHSERRKHLIVLGKSGFGKTTIALRMIQEDLRGGTGICILGSEAELFRDWLLPLVPYRRAQDVIHFKPSDPECSLTWNPVALDDGDDAALAAGELFATFKRAIGEDSIGTRADAILSSAFAVLVGKPNAATLWSVVRLLEDASYRSGVVAGIDDPYLREFWTSTFNNYPANAVLPLASRLNQILRVPQLRAALCHPISSFSIREALAEGRIIYFDVSGFDPDATRVLGQMLLSKFQIELMRRERFPEEARKPVNVFVDEFHQFGNAAEGTWRELLARGRRYGLGLHLFTQHPNQLPRALQHEIFGNTSSVIVLNLAASDAAAVRRELLAPGPNGSTKPVPAEEIVSLPVGEGFARLGSGGCALRVRFAPPIEKPEAEAGERIRRISWKKYAAPPLPKESIMAMDTAKDGVPAVASTAPEAQPHAAVAGRGGQQHKLLQRLARQWGEDCGFRSSVEEEILGGAGRVDVALVRGDVRIAVEVAITSPPQQVIASVTKALAAGFGQIVVLSSEARTLRLAEERIAADVSVGDRKKVQLLTPDDFRSFLDLLPGGPDAHQGTVGYRVNVDHEPKSGARQAARRRALAHLVGTALLRRRWPA